MSDSRQVGRRTVLKAAAATLLLPQLELLHSLATAPDRAALAAAPALPAIQFDIGQFIPAANSVTVNGVSARFGPVFTVFAPAMLMRTPTQADQTALEQALSTIESAYPFSPQGVFTFVSYGIPYFQRLPGGLAGPLLSSHLPRLLSDQSRLALEEAVPGPTDVTAAGTVQKARFNVPVQIERNDLLFMVRSDRMQPLTDVLGWLRGSGSLAGRSVPSPLSGLLQWQTPRLQFVQRGLPHKLADSNQLPYAAMVNPDSSMWMGFVDQHADASGPAAIVTFAGNAEVRMTTAQPGDYFAEASIQHLAHVILDLGQWYGMAGGTAAQTPRPYSDRIQGMFSSPAPVAGTGDQITDGGGPAFVPNKFQGAGAAEMAAAATKRIGHLAAIQRVSRTAKNTPLHVRMDGPGFNSLDVADGSMQPTLEFTVVVPTAKAFRQMRIASASVDLAQKYGVPSASLGVEAYSTATRRQNFLLPPRAHRAFPLLELASASPSTGPARSPPAALTT